MPARHYGGGSLRRSAPLAPAIHLGASRLLAISVRHPRTAAAAAEQPVQGYPPAAQVLGMVMNAVFLDALSFDGERVARVNALIAELPPGKPVPDDSCRFSIVVGLSRTRSLTR